MKKNIQKSYPQKRFNKKLLLIVYISLLLVLKFNFICIAQVKEPINAFKLPNIFSKTTRWKEADSFYKRNFIDGFNNDKPIVYVPHGSIARELKFSDYLKIIKKQSDIKSFLIAKNWAIKNYKEFFPYLIMYLTDTSVIDCRNLNDTVITVESKTIKVIRKNICTVAGRASFILNELTGEKFSFVTCNSTFDELKKYQKLWVGWIKKLPN